MRTGIAMPDEQQLPPGPLRELTAEIHEFYRAAGRPALRDVSDAIKENDGLRGSPSHTTVQKMLRGEPTSWENIEALVHELATRGRQPERVHLRIDALNLLWNQACDAASQILPMHEPGPDRSHDIVDVTDDVIIDEADHVIVEPVVPDLIVEQEQRIRQAVFSRDYDRAFQMLEDLAVRDAARVALVRREIGFIELPDQDRAIVAAIWDRVAVGNDFHPETRDVIVKSLRTAAGPERSIHDPTEGGTLQGMASSAVKRSRAVGSTAVAGKRASDDADPVPLLKDLFHVDPDDERALLVKSKSDRPLHAAEFRGVSVNGGTKCHVLCRNQQQQVGIRAFAYDFTEREPSLTRDAVDYLVMFSFGSSISDELRDLVADWNSRNLYRFHILLFGQGELSDLTLIRGALSPSSRLPTQWRRYLTEPALLCLADENASRLDEVYQRQLPMRVTTDVGTQLDGHIFYHVDRWLAVPDAPTLLVLGDFGDGKTFFTYSLARRMCEAFGRESAWVPLRLALKDLPTAGSGRELLRRRLELFGADVPSWRAMTGRHNGLIILDGFDEMTTDLSREAMVRNFRLLRECFSEFDCLKVLLTSRSRAFGPPADQRQLLERIGAPQVLHLAPVERSHVLSSLRSSATDARQQRMVDRLRDLHDPIGLATKPLYHELLLQHLPHLPEGDLNEQVLYDLHIRDTLQRKLDYLEDEDLQVPRGDIVENLLEILERVAIELHRTNARFVYLKDIKIGEGLAYLLWKIREGAGSASQGRDDDATARVGIRSLLKGVPDGDPQRWPVDFFHRSMREYFFARALIRTIGNSVDSARTLLASAPLSVEILHFAGLIARGGTGVPESTILSLALLAQSAKIGDKPTYLGGNAVSLMFAAAGGRLPHRDWTRLRLDHAQLPGADLSGMSFQGTSLREANLDNADLTAADFTGADLSGVRLAETAPVTAVAIAGHDRVLAAYGDKTIREWIPTGTLNSRDKAVCSLDFPATGLCLLPGGSLMAVGDGEMVVLSASDDEWKVAGRFASKSRYRPPAYSRGYVLLVEEMADGSSKLLWLNPARRSAQVLQAPPMRACAALGRQAIAVASPDRVHVLVADPTGRSAGTPIVWSQPGVNTIALRAEAANILIATGHDDGTTTVEKLSRKPGGGWERHRVWQKRLHSGPVESLGFLGPDRLATGGLDRSICIAPISQDPAIDVRRFKLTIRCEGVRIEGLHGPSEYQLLRKLSRRTPIEDPADKPVRPPDRSETSTAVTEMRLIEVERYDAEAQSEDIKQRLWPQTLADYVKDPELRERVLRLAQVPQLLVATAYDGTIAPIVEDPATAAPLPEAVAALRSLASLPQTTVAVISGRALNALTALARLPSEIHLVGSHGAEFDVGFVARLEPRLQQVRDKLMAALEALAAGHAGIELEAKPASIAVHTRTASDAVTESIMDKVRTGPAQWPDVHTTEGKEVIELSVLARHKGTAIEELRRQVSADAVLFVGDDMTDESAFKVLSGKDFGVKVGPGETVADYRVADPLQAVRVLGLLLETRRNWLFGERAVPIERHSMLSDGRTVALITPEARVSWLCHPRPDSAALFADLLGGASAGHFTIYPQRGGHPLGQRYRTGTMTVETRWSGLTITDWLDGDHLLRRLTGNTVTVVEFAPRPEFGQIPVRLEKLGDCLMVLGTSEHFVLHSAGVEWDVVNDGGHDVARAVIDLNAMGGEVLLDLRMGSQDLLPYQETTEARLERAERPWKEWSKSLNLPPLETDLVLRSALTLKGLCHAEGGGVLAAATTSLPETLGGIRNWDYRFSWLHDAAMSVRALVDLGSITEAEAFLRWVATCVERTGRHPERLHPLYTVDGNELGPEAVIETLPGYAGSRPVRVGNAANKQLQLDMFGPVADVLMAVAEKRGGVKYDDWRVIEAIVHAVEQRWHEPDDGPWEARLPPRHHVYSKVMCWMTVDRAVKMLTRHTNDTSPEWEALRDRIADNVLTQGWHEGTGAYTVAYGSPEMDASSLWIGLSGLLPDDDPRFLATVLAVEAELRSGPTVYRYKWDDGMPGKECGFHVCTAWLIEAYLRTGRRTDAEELFEQLLATAGPTGLLPKQYDPDIEKGLGNHPFALSHVGLIRCAQLLTLPDIGKLETG